MRTVYIFLVLFALTSCNREQNGRILSKKDFVNVLVDIHMADAMVMDHSIAPNIGEIDSLTLYSSVFKKHNIDKATFDSTLRWYSQHPKKFAEVYDDVFGRINKFNQELTDEQALFGKNGTKSLLKTTTALIIDGDTASYPKPYIIQVDTLGFYLVEIKMRMQPQDKSVDPRILSYFYKNKDDNKNEERMTVVNFPIQKSSFIRDYQFSTKLEDKSYKFLKIIVPQTKNSDTIFTKNIQISEIKVSYLKESVEKEDKANKKKKADKKDSLNKADNKTTK